MPVDRERQITVSAILDRDVYEEFKKLCKKNKRSASAQISLLVENFIEYEIRGEK